MRRYVLLAVLALLAAGCGGYGDGDEETGAPAGTPVRTITIEETDFALDPNSVALETPGTYAFEVVNEGQVSHALEIEGEGIEEETETLDPGERASLSVELEAGSYELYCPVGNHRERGMTGKIEIQSSDTGNSGSDY